MYKNLISLGMTLLLVSFMVACKSSEKECLLEKSKTSLVGNDKDDHGCIASAGYQWSELLHDCIRPFEQGIKLNSFTDPSSSFVAYLVFNKNSSKVEVYLPKMESRPILEKQAQDVWGEQGPGKISVTYVDGIWRIFMGDAQQYVSSPQE